MMPYRLEMGTKLANARGKDLYAFWGSTSVNGSTRRWPSKAMTYCSTWPPTNTSGRSNVKALNARIINTEFKDLKNGQHKIISFYAKKARGMMSRFVIKERIHNPEHLKAV